MNLKHLAPLGLALVATLTAPAASAITVIIDDFNANNVSIEDLTANSTPVVNSSTLASGPTINLVRNLSINLLSTVPPTSNTVAVTGGFLDVINGVGEDSEVIAFYNLPANFVNVVAPAYIFQMQVVGSDSNPISVDLRFNSTLLSSFSLPGNQFNTVLSTPLTPAQISTINGGGLFEIVLNGTAGWDATFDSFGFSVPAPASLLLFGAGMIGLGLFRAKKAK